jgi:hypothetical protein
MREDPANAGVGALNLVIVAAPLAIQSGRVEDGRRVAAQRLRRDSGRTV